MDSRALPKAEQLNFVGNNCRGTPLQLGRRNNVQLCRTKNL